MRISVAWSVLCPTLSICWDCGWYRISNNRKKKVRRRRRFRAETLTKSYSVADKNGIVTSFYCQPTSPTDRDRGHVLGVVGVAVVLQVLQKVAPCRRPTGQRGLKARGCRKDARAAVQRGGRGGHRHSRRPNADRRPTGAWQLVACGGRGARVLAAGRVGRPQQDGGLVGFVRGAQHGCPLQVVAHGDGVAGA